MTPGNPPAVEWVMRSFTQRDRGRLQRTVSEGMNVIVDAITTTGGYEQNETTVSYFWPPRQKRRLLVLA